MTNQPSPSALPEGPVLPTERKLVSDVGKMAGASAAAQFITVIGGLVLARVLGVQFYGLWKTVQLAVTYTAFGNLGSTYGLSRAGPAVFSKGNASLYNRMMGASLGVSWVIGGLLAATFLAWAAGEHAAVRFAAGALAALCFIQPLAMHGETALIVEKKFGANARVLLGTTFVRVVFSIGAALAAGLAGALAVYILVYAATALWMMRLVSARLRPAIDMQLWRKVARVGLPITLLSVGELLFTTADKWIVVGVLGAEAMSLYQMAIFPLPFLMLAPFNLRQVVTVDVYDKFGRTGDLSECRPVFQTSLLSISLGAPWLIGGVYLGMPWLIDWLLPEYRPAIGIVQLHAILIFPVLAIQTAYPIVVVARERKRVLLALLGVTALSSVASFAATSYFGAGMTLVLGLHAAGWLAAAVWLLHSALRWTGASRKSALRWTLQTLLPMALLAVELPAIVWLGEAAGLEPHSFTHAAACGAVHTVVCLPLFWMLEKRTSAISYLFGRILGRFARR